MRLTKYQTPDSCEKNICQLLSPGTLRSEILKSKIDKRLPLHVQYACQYWIFHLQESKVTICDDGPVHKFLLTHLLYWIEALSLMGCIPEIFAMLTSIQSMVDVSTLDMFIFFD